MMDLVFTIGHYVMTSWALSSFGVPIEGGADAIGFDLRTASGRIPGKTWKPGEDDEWVETRGY
jgi:4-carboxymuconolactone decarboxylase